MTVSPPEKESVPTTVLYAYPRRYITQNRQTAFALTDKSALFSNKDSKHSGISKPIEMPTLKSKSVAPSVQKIDPCIWNSWTGDKQEKYLRLVRDFKFKALQMLKDGEEDNAFTQEQVDLAVQHDPGAFGFGSNAFSRKNVLELLRRLWLRR